MTSIEKIAYNFTFTHDELDAMDALVSEEGNEYAIDKELVLNKLKDELYSKYSVAWNREDLVVSMQVLKPKLCKEVLFSFLLLNRNPEACIDARFYNNVANMRDKRKAVSEGNVAAVRNFKRRGIDDSDISKYLVNMCQKQVSDKEPVKVGVNKFVKQMIQTLSRKTMCCPILIGDRGVGKTAIVKEFVNKIIADDVPEWLKGVTVYSLDIVKMVAGAKYRGDFEGRLVDTLEAIAKTKDVILFLDNTHNIVGSGANADMAIDGSAIIEPYISDGRIKVIGATTFENYKHILEPKDTLSRCFYTINVDEPDTKRARAIVGTFSEELGKYHKLEISDKVINTAVSLAKRYKTAEKLPSSAINLLDEACAKQRILESDAVAIETLYSVLSEQMGIPLNRLTESDSKKLLKLEETLSSRVIGQEEAIKALAQSLRCSRVGLNDETKPLGSFIFAGSTGVGKTELCKTLAAEMFNDETAIVRVDMSEYMESHSVSKLIGAPKGYVGYGEGGYLTDAVAKKPYSIVLFDEIEKAHPQVMNILLQVLDDGRLTDSSGKTVDFKNTIIIMTTNLGAKKKGEDTHIGFGSVSETDRKADFIASIKQAMRPEFINRVDDIIIFNKLDETIIKDIARKMLDDFVVTAKGHNISVTYNDSVVDYCAKEGYDSEMGARPMLHFISKNISSKVANWFLDGSIKRNATYELNFDGELCLKEVVTA